MSTMTMTMPSTPIASGRMDKPVKKQSKVVTLSLPSSTLKRFLPKEPTPSTASSPAPTIEEVSELKKVASHEQQSESTSTPAPTQEVSTPGGSIKKKAAVQNGVKRSTPMPSDSASKPRGKPGPKKKPRLEDGTIDHTNKPAVVGTAPAHKLGPKANTGFINANLRALDRTGAPCRRWEKKGFNLKSFTGHSWELSSWKGFSKPEMTNGASDGSNDISMPGSSEQKQSDTDTATGSHAGEHVERMDIATPAASPPPSVLLPAPLPMQVDA